MPTYVCSAATGRLTSDQKAEIVRTVITWPANWRLRIRYGLEAIFEADGPTSRRAGCADG